MSENGKHKNIEELYRDMLGNREHAVSESFWPKFSKRLRFREFMQFRPGSFNIYYLASIAAAAAIAISVLVNDRQDDMSSVPDIIISEDSLTSEQDQIITEEEQTPLPAEVQNNEPVDKVRVEIKDDQPADKEEIKGIANPPDRSEEIAEINPDTPDRISIDRNLGAETIIAPAPIAKFMPDRNKGCAPQTIHFKNLSHNYDSCIWEFDDGGLSTEDSPVWVYDEEGEYRVRLVVFGKNEQRAVTQSTIVVHGKPEARFELSKGNPYLPDEEVQFYNYSQNAVKWNWDFGDGTESEEYEPSHFYDKPGSYTVTLTAISEYGCIDSMVITNAFGDNTCYIKFPNAFVPNEGGPTGGYYSARSDMQEEVFHPVYSGVTSYNLRIYSRKGLLVFETDDIEIGWDGYYKGQKAEPGVYIWKVRGVYKNGEPFVKGGDVTLLPKW